MDRRKFITYSLAATTIAPAAMAQDTAEIELPEMSLGSPDASVTMIEYASFTCPHCANFHKDVMPQLKTDYIDTGKVKFIYREVYFDRLGLWGGMLARCGGPEKYFGIVDMLYKRQREWTAGSGVEVAENLYKIGRIAGLKNENMVACLQDQDMAKALIADYQKNAEADGIDSTPSFVINGVKYNNQAYGGFKKVLDEILES
ncbi:MAG: DsbA family protein [Amylibacter sp.]|nr:DsbA family protein [Amylibacter sp.]